jgi:hypothetical protein
VLDHFKERGSGWQTAINETLRKAVTRRKGPKVAKQKFPARKQSR